MFTVWGFSQTPMTQNSMADQYKHVNNWAIYALWFFIMRITIDTWKWCRTAFLTQIQNTNSSHGENNTGCESCPLYPADFWLHQPRDCEASENRWITCITCSYKRKSRSLWRTANDVAGLTHTRYIRQDIIAQIISISFFNRIFLHKQCSHLVIILLYYIITSKKLADKSWYLGLLKRIDESWCA